MREELHCSDKNIMRYYYCNQYIVPQMLSVQTKSSLIESCSSGFTQYFSSPFYYLGGKKTNGPVKGNKSGSCIYFQNSLWFLFFIHFMGTRFAEGQAESHGERHYDIILR